MAANVRLLENRWDDGYAAGLDEPGKLLYRSNLLGADKRITNYGGGNTSAKVMETDPLTGEKVKVLWVKGSGGDVGTIKLDGFATLYQDKLEALKGIYKGVADEDRMVGFLPHCTFNLNARAASIDTPLHGFVPFTHVDHMHPDAIIAIAASKNSRELTKRIFGDEIGWLPWRRPGFQLGLDLEAFVKANPNAKGVVLESHGLFTWANDAKACYELTLDIINKAIEWFAGQTEGKTIFGGAAVQNLPVAERRAIAARLMPEIRGRIGKQERKLGHFDDQDAVLEFVNSNNLRPLGALGTSCPDHFLRTKIRPLIVEFDPAKPDVDAIVAGLDKALEDYRADYARYYNDCKHDNSPAMRDAIPSSSLFPASACCPLLATRRLPVSPANSTSMPSTSCAALDGLGISGPAGAGSLRYRILAARRGQAAAHAEAEEPCRQGRLCHRWRRRHRPGDGRAPGRGRRLRGACRYRSGSA